MLITLSGPSTVGKDSSWLRLAETLGFKREVPYTTRLIRSNETDGIDYLFITVKLFHEMIKSNKLTEWDYTLGHYYGTGLSLQKRVFSGENIVLQVLARMAIRLKAKLKDVKTIILLTSEINTLESRLKARKYIGEELQLRILHGEEEASYASLFDFVVPDADILTEAEIIRILDEIMTSS